MDTLAFRYTAFAVSSVHPRGGTLAGGTRLLVRGRGFSDLGGLHCVFGNDAVPATLIEPRALRCDSPSASLASIVPLSVSINGELSTRSLEHGNTSFAFFDQSLVVISSLSPSLGPDLGGTPVTVRGNGFIALGTVQCKFGQHDAVNGSYHMGVSSDSVLALPLVEIVCYSPPHIRGPSSGSGSGGEAVPFRVSLTGDAAEFTADGTSFLYHHACRGSRLEADARAAVSRYLSLNRPNLTALDVNADGSVDAAELRGALQRLADNGTATHGSSPSAFQAYEASICDINGRPLARHDDWRTSDGLETGPPTAPSDLQADGRQIQLQAQG